MGSLVKQAQLDINTAMSICARNGVRVYPVTVGNMFAIEVVKETEKPKRYEELVSGKEVATAHRKTYIAWAKHILKQQQDADSTNTKA